MCGGHREGAQQGLCAVLAGLHQLREAEMVLQGAHVIAHAHVRARGLATEGAHHGCKPRAQRDGQRTRLSFVNVLDFTRM